MTLPSSASVSLGPDPKAAVPGASAGSSADTVVSLERVVLLCVLEERCYTGDPEMVLRMGPCGRGLTRELVVWRPGWWVSCSVAWQVFDVFRWRAGVRCGSCTALWQSSVSCRSLGRRRSVSRPTCVQTWL